MRLLRHRLHDPDQHHSHTEFASPSINALAHAVPTINAFAQYRARAYPARLQRDLHGTVDYLTNYKPKFDYFTSYKPDLQDAWLRRAIAVCVEVSLSTPTEQPTFRMHGCVELSLSASSCRCQRQLSNQPSGCMAASSCHCASSCRCQRQLSAQLQLSAQPSTERPAFN
jgi:hypothetical protein